jgi:hypothetical protein
MPIVRHVKVRTDASIYDGNLLYWASRLGRHPQLPASRANLLKRQRGRCAWCGLFFTTMDDVMEVDHKVPRSRGGTDMPHNRQLLHGHCHDEKTTGDASTAGHSAFTCQHRQMAKGYSCIRGPDPVRRHMTQGRQQPNSIEQGIRPASLPDDLKRT